MSPFSKKLSEAADDLVNDRKRRANESQKFYEMLSKDLIKDAGVRQIVEAIRLSDRDGDSHYLRVCSGADIGSIYDLGLTAAGFVSTKHGAVKKMRARHFLKGTYLPLEARTAALQGKLLDCVHDFDRSLHDRCLESKWNMCIDITFFLACLPCICIKSSIDVIKDD